MGYLNKLFAIGRVGKIYPSSTFQNGDKVVRFSLACSKVYKNANGETVEITKWWSIVAKNITKNGGKTTVSYQDDLDRFLPKSKVHLIA